VLLVFALLLGMMADTLPGGQISSAQTPGQVAALAWVRTSSGWERPEVWREPPRWSPTLHPFVVAGGQLLGSLLALVAFNMPSTSRRIASVPR
jgi:hypothetical protein